MQMNHPLWPVVRESARRVVRIEKISITAPDEYASEIVHLSSLIGDHVPQRSTFPVHRKSEKEEIWIYDDTRMQSPPIIYIGNTEPQIDVCWIELPINDGFNAIMESCEQLLNAGYPGCVGCDESIQEGRWDEEIFRAERKKLLK